jgi:hypothetical protein
MYLTVLSSVAPQLAPDRHRTPNWSMGNTKGKRSFRQTAGSLLAVGPQCISIILNPLWPCDLHNITPLIEIGLVVFTSRRNSIKRLTYCCPFVDGVRSTLLSFPSPPGWRQWPPIGPHCKRPVAGRVAKLAGLCRRIDRGVECSVVRVAAVRFMRWPMCPPRFTPGHELRRRVRPQQVAQIAFAPFGRCVRSRFAEVWFVPRWGGPKQAITQEVVTRAWKGAGADSVRIRSPVLWLVRFGNSAERIC